MNGEAPQRKPWKLWYAKHIKLPTPISTPMGSKVRVITFALEVSFDRRAEDGKWVANNITLQHGTHNVASKGGEAWRADSNLQEYLEQVVIPNLIEELIANDTELQRFEWDKYLEAQKEERTKKKTSLCGCWGCAGFFVLLAFLFFALRR